MGELKLSIPLPTLSPLPTFSIQLRGITPLILYGEPIMTKTVRVNISVPQELKAGQSAAGKAGTAKP